MTEPYYDRAGALVIPMKAPLRYRWWLIDDVAERAEAFRLARESADRFALTPAAE